MAASLKSTPVAGSGSSIALPAHAVGDLLVILCHNNASANTPTAPSAGGTVPAWSLVVGGNGTANGCAAFCAIATATNHTSGTFGLTTGIIAAVVVGFDTTTPIGAGARGNGGSGANPITISGPTALDDSSGASLLIYGGGVVTSSVSWGTPTAGFTTQVSSVAGRCIFITKDSSTAIAACSVPTGSSTNYRVLGFEIRSAVAPVYTDTPSGGIVMGGSIATGWIPPASTPSGGLVLGGTVSGTRDLALSPSGGIVLGGSSVTSTSLAPSGGIVLGGSITSQRIIAYTQSAGIVMGGSHTSQRIIAYTQSGGIILSGSCSSNTGTGGSYNDFPTGGIRLGGSPTTVQFIAVTPNTDISDGQWTDQVGGSDLFAAIDEPSPVDTDYIKSKVSPLTADICEVSLPGVIDPQASTGHVLTYRYGSDQTGYTTVAQTLSGAQADAIANYAHLTVKFEAVI